MHGTLRRIFRVAVITGLLLLSLPQAVRAADEPIKNKECLDCHADKTLTRTNSAGREISLFADEAKLAASVHKKAACVDCHADLTRKHPDDNVPAQAAACATCHKKQSASYGASVHGMAHGKGNLVAANCSDCHDGHTIMPPDSANSPLNFSRLAQTCGACHEAAAKDVAESIHGRALAAGHREAPTSTDCHAEHRIETLKGSSPMKISLDVCSRCHASERMNTKFKLPQDRVKTFFDSYHGLAAQYGSTLAANCASCHGVHKILPSRDPRSTINAAHLPETCGKCHPGATEQFALGKVHIDAAANSGGLIGEQINWWIRKLYLWLIAAVIGGMLLHNGLLLARRLAAINRSRDRAVLRMNRHQRIQHALLAISFIVLAITGFALKFPDSWIGRMLGWSEPFRRWSHRVAGIVMLAAGVYHVLYLLLTREGRQLLRDFFPIWKDVLDVFGMLGYLIGLRAQKPQFRRFGYAEKMEYWAVVWGTIIMGGSGLMIWFKLDVTRFLPRWAVDAATNIHFYEAILACLAIVVWHFYHVLFAPEVYPLNWACWDGMVSRHWQDEEHGLDHEADLRTKADAAAKAPTVTPAQPREPRASA